MLALMLTMSCINGAKVAFPVVESGGENNDTSLNFAPSVSVRVPSNTPLRPIWRWNSNVNSRNPVFRYSLDLAVFTDNSLETSDTTFTPATD